MYLTRYVRNFEPVSEWACSKVMSETFKRVGGLGKSQTVLHHSKTARAESTTMGVGQLGWHVEDGVLHIL